MFLYIKWAGVRSLFIYKGILYSGKDCIYLCIHVLYVVCLPVLGHTIHKHDAKFIWCCIRIINKILFSFAIQSNAAIFLSVKL